MRQPRVMSRQPWQEMARRGQSDTFNKIPPEWLLDSSVLAEAKSRRSITGSFIPSLLSQEELEITESDATRLVKYIAEETLTALRVAQAFCKRAAFAHQLNNCLLEIFFEDALARARELDLFQKKNSRTSGPLHGLPISLKDQFHVKNVDTTIGYIGRIGTYEGHPKTRLEGRWRAKSSVNYLHLVHFCTTSVPQTLLLGETHNNIIGYTMNPVVQHLSCGGSSGGEAALQVLGGSCLGIGTDIGGSVRIPASFCGTFSIKPSYGRFSYQNVANSNPGQTIMPSAIGFMATSLLSLKLVVTTILSTQPWLRDPDVQPLPWAEQKMSSDFCNSNAEKEVSPKFSFAIFAHDGIVMPHPPIQRGLQMVTKALKGAGHEIISWNPPSHADGLQIHENFIVADGGANIFEQLRLSGEPYISELSDDYGPLPRKPATLEQYQNNALHRKRYLAEYMRYWNSTSQKTSTGRVIDAVILPVAPHAAVIPGKYYYYGYSEIVDLLDYTSVCIPITVADKCVDCLDESYKPLNNIDRKNWDAYDPEVYDGAPVGIQLMGRRLDEERMLCVAGVVMGALKQEAESGT